MNSNIKKIVAIINPISGVKSKEKVPALLQQIIGNNPEFDLSIEFTRYAGHATELARKAVEENADYVVAVGGDGTINEIAKSLIHTDTALAILPFGSGNGLARHLCVPMNTEKAIRTILDQQVVSVDYCRANDRIFFCTAGVGFDAWISKKFAEDGQRGKFTYVKNVLQEYFSYTPHTYKISVDGRLITEKAFVVTFANASQYGNNAYIAPQASMRDGLIDITVMHPFNLLQAPALALQMFTKQLTRNSNVTSLKGRHIIIDLEGEEVMHVDGEPVIVKDHIDISIVASALKVVTNKISGK